ncbi:Short-chain dehydrogenase/reductase family protein [Mycena venus]|uniref:Short-chain dehydrogenase/reductase family protein n=1 Tax=Mycena venus TaxID=2733690 RepID=A0A8H6YVK1_9AGAR|nr:Short-chain dehydrogenase/reductase family protein [Mycena venus]
MEPNFTLESTAEEVATAFAKEIENKNVLITGTSLNGLGFETARVIAKYASLVIITGYNAERLRLSEEALLKEVPSANIRCLILDLSSLTNVRKAAAEVNAYAEPIHVLINNAAAPMGTFKLTADGLENQIATDHVGPFLFTKLLTPKLLAATTPTYTPRVVNVGSNAHHYAPEIDFATIFKPDKGSFNTTVAYGQAKSANILATIELAKRARGKLNAYVVHPGVIYTNLNQHPEAIPVLKQMGLLDENGEPSSARFQWKTIPQGAASTVVAAFDPYLDDKSGVYLVDCQIATETIAPHTSDPTRAEMLWNLTEEIIGEKFKL